MTSPGIALLLVSGIPPVDGVTFSGLAGPGSLLTVPSASPPTQYLNVGTLEHPIWNLLATGTALPGVTSDHMNGVLAQNFTAYPVIADPAEGPILTAVLASDFSLTPLPAGNYEYAVAYEDEPGNRTNFVGSSSIALDGTQLVQVEPPASCPSSVLFVGYARLANDGAFWISPLGTDVGTPYIDFLDDAALIALNQPLNLYNQTYPTATLGPTTIEGSVAAKTALAEWNATPQTTQPLLIASRADTQAQIDELVALLVAKGSLVDNRTA